METQQFFHMKGGEDKASYAENSWGQKFSILKVKDHLEKCIEEFCISNKHADCLKIADLGCSSGPNTILIMKMIIEIIGNNWRKLNRLNPPPIQFFLNDLFFTDFNTVFKSLPAFYQELEKNGCPSGSCFVTAMPGSFHNRLFPENSMHFVHCASSLLWLSQVPIGLKSETGLPLNKGNIYIAKNSPAEVHETYLDQFRTDFTKFLQHRSIEMVTHGHLFLHLPSYNEDNDSYSFRDILAMALNEMVTEGLVEEEAFDTFNLPMYEPSPEEARDIIEKERSFQVMHLEAIEMQFVWQLIEDKLKGSDLSPYFDNKGLSKKGKYMITGSVIASIRAVVESIIASHFGEAILDELFCRFAVNYSENLDRMWKSSKTLVICLSKKIEEIKY